MNKQSTWININNFLKWRNRNCRRCLIKSISTIESLIDWLRKKSFQLEARPRSLLKEIQAQNFFCSRTKITFLFTAGGRKQENRMTKRKINQLYPASSPRTTWSPEGKNSRAFRGLSPTLYTDHIFVSRHVRTLLFSMLHRSKARVEAAEFIEDEALMQHLSLIVMCLKFI